MEEIKKEIYKEVRGALLIEFVKISWPLIIGLLPLIYFLIKFNPFH